MQSCTRLCSLFIKLYFKAITLISEQYQRIYLSYSFVLFFEKIFREYRTGVFKTSILNKRKRSL